MDTARKHSVKRDALLKFMRGSLEHPGAEDAYAALKPEYPSLSLGTVYRNLAMFKRTGQVISVGFVNGQERFDARTSPHAHFVCEKCGSVRDVFTAELPDEFLAAAGSAGGRVTGYSLIFGGICGDCGGDKGS